MNDYSLGFACNYPSCSCLDRFGKHCNARASKVRNKMAIYPADLPPGDAVMIYPQSAVESVGWKPRDHLAVCEPWQPWLAADAIAVSFLTGKPCPLTGLQPTIFIIDERNMASKAEADSLYHLACTFPHGYQLAETMPYGCHRREFIVESIEHATTGQVDEGTAVLATHGIAQNAPPPERLRQLLAYYALPCRWCIAPGHDVFGPIDPDHDGTILAIVRGKVTDRSTFDLAPRHDGTKAPDIE